MLFNFASKYSYSPFSNPKIFKDRQNKIIQSEEHSGFIKQGNNGDRLLVSHKMDARTRNVLKYSGLSELLNKEFNEIIFDDLKYFNPDDFLGCRNAGKLTIKKLQAISKELNFKWYDDYLEYAIKFEDREPSRLLPADNIVIQQTFKKSSFIENIKQVFTEDVNSLVVDFPDNSEDIVKLIKLKDQGYKIQIMVTKPETN